MLGIRTHQMLEKPKAHKRLNFRIANSFAQKFFRQSAETISRDKTKKRALSCHLLSLFVHFYSYCNALNHVVKPALHLENLDSFEIIWTIVNHPEKSGQF